MSASFWQKNYVANILIKLLEKEEDEENYLEEQWTEVLSGFKKKHPHTQILGNRETVERIPFYLKRARG